MKTNVMIRTYCIMLLLTLSSIILIGCETENVIVPEHPIPNWMEYNPTLTHKVRPFTIMPEPGNIAHNQAFKLWFSRYDGVANVRIRNTSSEQELRTFSPWSWDKRFWKASNPISDITPLSDQPIYFAITWTRPGMGYESLVYQDEDGFALVNGQIVGPYYITAPDHEPPLILNSTVLPTRDPSLGAYPAGHIQGRTDVNPNTQEIVIAFNEPIRDYAKAGIGISSASLTDAKNNYLSWGEGRTSNAIILDALTPEELKKWQDETAVIEQQWQGTPLGTPMQDVKGEFVPVKVNTVHAEASTLLEPGQTYIISITVHDVVGHKSEMVITFQTAP